MDSSLVGGCVDDRRRREVRETAFNIQSFNAGLFKVKENKGKNNVAGYGIGESVTELKFLEDGTIIFLN